MMITVRTMILMDGRFEGRRDSDDGDDIDNIVNCDIDFGFYFLRQGRTSSEDGSEAAGEHTVTFHYHHSFIVMNYKNLN